MNLNHLKTFVTVVAKGSFSAAAREMHLTQPAVSKQISSLERYFALPLIQRGGRNIKLTPEGEHLYSYAVRILNMLEEMENGMVSLRGKPRGKILIGASTIPGQYLLPQIIGAFKKNYPGVLLVLEIGDSLKILEKMEEGVFDIGVVGVINTAWCKKNKNFVVNRLFEDEIVFVCPPNHRLCEKKLLKVKDILQEPIIWRGVGSGTRTFVEREFKKAGVPFEKLSVVTELGSTEAVITAVKSGMGTSFVSRLAAQKEEAAGSLVCLTVEDINLKRDLYILYADHPWEFSLVKVFVDFALSHVGENVNT